MASSKQSKQGDALAQGLANGIDAGLEQIGPALKHVGRILCHGPRSAGVCLHWHEAVKHAGLGEVHIRDVERVPVGHRLLVEVGKGRHSREDLRRSKAAIEGNLKVRGLRIDDEPSDARQAWVTLIERSGWISEIEPWPRLKDSKLDGPGSFWKPIATARDEYGKPVEIPIMDERIGGRSMLLGGVPGAGKSVAVSMILAAAALDPTVRIALMDWKTVEFGLWRSCAERFVGPSMRDAVSLLEAIKTMVNARNDQLAAEGRRVIRHGDSQMPPYVLFIDELMLFTTDDADPKVTKHLNKLIRDIAALGRATGVIPILCTQKPEGQVVDTNMRDLIAYRLALRCETPEASDTILGRGWAAKGANAQTIAPDEPGVGYLRAEDGLPRRVRNFNLTDEDVTILVERARGLRDKAKAGGP